jgi:hypothetical protein
VSINVPIRQAFLVQNHPAFSNHNGIDLYFNLDIQMKNEKQQTKILLKRMKLKGIFL